MNSAAPVKRVGRKGRSLGVPAALRVAHRPSVFDSLSSVAAPRYSAGCSSVLIFPYMQSFTLIITFVFLNLFIGIILEGFSQAGETQAATHISEVDR